MCLVIDEADRMFDMGFIQATCAGSWRPFAASSATSLLFSATMPADVAQARRQRVLREPVRVEIAPASVPRGSRRSTSGSTS